MWRNLWHATDLLLANDEQTILDTTTRLANEHVAEIAALVQNAACARPSTGLPAARR